jgi:cell division protein FtsW
MNYIKKIIKIIKEKDECHVDNQPDISLFYAASILIIVSIVFSYSLSLYYVNSNSGVGPLHFFTRQLFFGILGIVIMWILSKQNPDKIIDYIGYSLFGFFLGLMILMPILPESIVKEIYGAKRWIKIPVIGLSIAPVEFFKIGFTYFIARSFTNNVLIKDKRLDKLEELKIYYPYIGLITILVLIIPVSQKDFGQFVLIILLLYILLIFANRSWHIFALLGGSMIVGFIILISLQTYRVSQRIGPWWSTKQEIFLQYLPNSWADNLRLVGYDESYQVGHSLNAIQNGGFFGNGIGEGTIKMGYLSEVHTDFVLSGISEEIGFFGLLIVVGVLVFIIQRIIRISRKVENAKYHLFTLGIALLISISLLINFGGITSSIPIKGMAVPFLSYGGSSMLSMCIALGLVLSISRKLPSEARCK